MTALDLTDAPSLPPVPPLASSSASLPHPPFPPSDSKTALAASGLTETSKEQKQDSTTVHLNAVLVGGAEEEGGGDFVEGARAPTQAVKRESPLPPKRVRRTTTRVATVVKAARAPDELPHLRAQGLLGPPGYANDCFSRLGGRDAQFGPTRSRKVRRTPISSLPSGKVSAFPAAKSTTTVTPKTGTLLVPAEPPVPSTVPPIEPATTPAAPEPLPRHDSARLGLGTNGSTGNWARTECQVFVRYEGQPSMCLTVPKRGAAVILLKLVADRLHIENNQLTLSVAGKPVRPQVDLEAYELHAGSTLFASSTTLPGGAPQKEKRPIAPAPSTPRKRARLTDDHETDDDLDARDYDSLDDDASDGNGAGSGDEAETSEPEFEPVKMGDYTFWRRRSTSKYLDYRSRVEAAARKAEIALHRLRKEEVSYLRKKSILQERQNLALAKEVETLKGKLRQEQLARNRLEAENAALRARPAEAAREQEAHHKAQHRQPSAVSSADRLSRLTTLREARLKAVDVSGKEPSQAEYEMSAADMTFDEFFSPVDWSSAKSTYDVVDLREALPIGRSPKILFRIAESAGSGSGQIYAASHLGSLPIQTTRQFPEYAGSVLFGALATVLAHSDRFDWNMFTVSDKYLLVLLTSPMFLEWAKRPNSYGIFRISHSVAHRLLPIVEKASEAIALHLLKAGVPDARRPRFGIEQVRTTGSPHWHSKLMLAISTDGGTLFVLEGSGNPSKQGFGGAATDDAGATLNGSSHETATLITAPVHSEYAVRLLDEATRFRAHLASARRLLPTNRITAAPIRQEAKLKAAEETLELEEQRPELVKAKGRAAAARKEAWEERFNTIKPYSFTFPVPPAPRAPILSILDSTAADNPAVASQAQVRLPQVQKELTFLDGSDAKAGQWHHDQRKGDGDDLVKGTVFCLDCGVGIKGSMPRSKMESYVVRHQPVGSACPEYLGPFRSIFLEDIGGKPQDHSALFDAFKNRLHQWLLVFYSALTHDLSCFADFRAALLDFANSLPAAHPARQQITFALAKKENHHVSVLLRGVLGGVMSEPRTDYEDGKQRRERTLFHGFLNEVVDELYSQKTSNDPSDNNARVEESDAEEEETDDEYLPS